MTQQNSSFPFYFASWYRKSPYFQRTVEAGCTSWDLYNHMLIPTLYDDDVKEYWHLLNHVTLWDVAVERQVEITGPDAARFVQLLTPRDLSTCAVGQGKYVLICDADGGIINDPVMTRMDEQTFWFALASSDALLFARGLKNAYPDLDVTIREADVAPLQVQGPKSRDLMTKLVGPEILELKYYFWTKATIAGASVVITRTGWTSEVGYEVYLTETSKGTEVFEAIMEAGREFGIKPTGPSDIRRIEGAIFNWGADMTYEHNAYQLGLDRLVDLSLSDEECLSIAAYRRIADDGVTTKINGVVFDGDPFPGLNNVKWTAVAEGEPVGLVTSAIYSPRLSQNIGYCWLPADQSREGTTVTVDSEWGSRTATVTPMPFVDPAKRIPVS
jgi:glycine cleavage system aminomethyltransferase T